MPEGSVPIQSFGANEWVVEEIRRQYREDPDSVDPSWREFFGSQRAGAGTRSEATGGRSIPAPSTSPAGAPERIPAPTADASPDIPTATSVRAFPAKLLIDNRIVINNHLKRARGGKVSVTHLVGYALVRAARLHPGMNHSYTVHDGKPTLVKPEHISLGLSVDVVEPNGAHRMDIAVIKQAETMDFRTFWQSCEAAVARTRAGRLTPEERTGVTLSLANLGAVGTVHAVPRLPQAQGTIVTVGAMEYRAEFQGTSQDTLNRLGISKTMTLTSTYDHRVIQGAASGEFLRTMHQLLLGEDDFYDEVFTSLRIPYEPVRWVADVTDAHDDVAKAARVFELIHSYRVRGHVMADTDPLEYKQRKHPDLDITEHGLTLWDLEREFAVGGFAGKSLMKLRDILGVLRDSYCRTTGIEFMHIQDPKQRKWIQDRVERRHAKPEREEQLRILRRLNAAEAFETFLQTKYV
ncbi:2-oxo acid dehydrogenase subunit E2, partial [Streptomyces sp. NPDC046942]|uniref:2-oxo acid dehydrogenase subunit E2 n=1 Tax=Streptomyces sp. NPDC046942 TaxID=3155137 RepID=UPI0033C3BE47